jgi:hypothetical protein
MSVQQSDKYYPERAKVIFIVNAPWIFPLLWNLVSLFVDQATKIKIQVLYSHDALQAHIATDQLPIRYGGTALGYESCVRQGGRVPPHSS